MWFLFYFFLSVASASKATPPVYMYIFVRYVYNTYASKREVFLGSSFRTSVGIGTNSCW